MSKLLMLKGLPASGKSTYAKELVDNGWKRVNKDDLRAMIDNGKWSRENERHILSWEFAIAKGFLEQGFNVVVDDTNFAHEEGWEELAEVTSSSFEVKFFDTPLEECIRRDKERVDSVGEKVIRNMYNTFLKPKEAEVEKPIYDKKLPYCYIFDIDGTLAHMQNRSPYDWMKVGGDTVDKNIRSLNNILGFGTKIILVSGRDSVCREKTIEWLDENGITYHELYMRPEGDMRKDVDIKREIYENHIKGKYNVVGVFDDRKQVVKLWRSLGLTCLQVAEGNF